jgi:hypothetical protein
MDPGYFPSPLELENKIILKNSYLEFKRFKRGENVDEMDEEMDINKKDHPTEIKNRIQFLKNFNNTLSEGPLTLTQSSDLRDRINKMFPSKYEEKKNNLYTIEEVIENNKKKYMERYGKELKQTDCCYENNFLPLSESIFLSVHSGIDLTKLNLCGNCMRFKVERSHHCRQCGRCILKMDHHCPWLANCIGYKNYKSFCLLHFYGVLSTLLISLSFWEVLVNYNMNYNANLIFIVYVTFVYFINIGLMAFLFWLLIVNCGLLFSGQTIIEQADRERFPSKAHNIYDMGWYRNFTNVFGTNPLVWFIPFFHNNHGKGFIFETCDFILP